MGGRSYSFSSRSARAMSDGYETKGFTEIFEQAKKRMIHESMDPRNIRMREARDSAVHPYSFPIAFTMDITGSMHQVPHMLIKDGLPKMVTKTIQGGIESPAILFMAVGDSQAGDSAPLQIGQFESGDLELDTWLIRTWPEGGGGANAGESYLWSWYFLAYHTATDAWDKRKEKGLAVSFGDEPCLSQITQREYEEVMGEIDPKLGLQFPLRAEDLLKKAEERWNVFHLHFVDHRPTSRHWKDWLGQRLIEIPDYHTVPDTVAKLAVQNCSYCGKDRPEPGGGDGGAPSAAKDEDEDEEIIL